MRDAKVWLVVALLPLSLACVCTTAVTPRTARAPSPTAMPQMAATELPPPAPTLAPIEPTRPAPTAVPTRVAPSAVPTRPPTATRTPRPTSAPTAVPPSVVAGEDWSGICAPSGQDGRLQGNLPMGANVEVRGYLGVKSIATLVDGMMPFTLRPIPYRLDSNWTEACQIHVLIRRGEGPNQVKPLPKEFRFEDVVVLDKDGTTISGWKRSLDSFHVAIKGKVTRPYGQQMGPGVSNTLIAEEILLLP